MRKGGPQVLHGFHRLPPLHLILDGRSSIHSPATQHTNLACTPRFLLYGLGIFSLLFFYH